MGQSYVDFFRAYQLRTFEFIRELKEMVYRTSEGVSDVRAWIDNARRLLGLSEQLMVAVARPAGRDEVASEVVLQQRRLRAAQDLVRQQITVFERSLLS